MISPIDKSRNYESHYRRGLPVADVEYTPKPRVIDKPKFELPPEIPPLTDVKKFNPKRSIRRDDKSEGIGKNIDLDA